MAELISSKAFREAATAGALSAPMIVGIAGGYILEAKFGHIRKQLSARSASGEKSRRAFTPIHSAGSFQQEKVEIFAYMVDATEYSPGSPAPRYKRAAERLRQVHTALPPTGH